MKNRRLGPIRFGGMRARFVEQENARSEHPKLAAEIERIRERAKVLTELPDYVEAEYRRDIYRLIKNSKMPPEKLATWIRKAFRVSCKTGTTPCTVVVCATSKFEVKRASLLGRKLRGAISEGTSISKFEASLPLPDREAGPTGRGMGKRKKKT